MGRDNHPSLLIFQGLDLDSNSAFALSWVKGVDTCSMSCEQVKISEKSCKPDSSSGNSFILSSDNSTTQPFAL
jgi:hypothetical protein